MGFTVLELLIVITIFSFVSGILFVSLKQLSRANVVDVAARDVVSILTDARNRTLASIGDEVYGVYFSVNTITFFSGDEYDAGDPGNIVINLSPAVSIDTVALSGGADSVIFSRLSGKASATGTITIVLTNDPADTKTITVTDTGMVSVSE